jgi:hypothetical protein
LLTFFLGFSSFVFRFGIHCHTDLVLLFNCLFTVYIFALATA